MVYLKIKENCKEAKLLVKFLKTQSYVKIINKKDLPKYLTKEQLIDLGLIKAMKKCKRNKFVSRKRIMKKLGKNQ